MKKLAIVALLSITILGVICIWIVLPGKSVLSSTEEKKALQQLLGRQPVLTPYVAPATWTQHKSQYFSFSYPSWATVYAKDNQQAIKQGALDSFSFGLMDEHVYAVVQAITFSGILSEYPAVNLRLSQNNVYTPSATLSAHTTEVEFTKNTYMVEQSLFLLKNGKIVSIAITGYSQEKVQNIFTRLTQSLEVD